MRTHFTSFPEFSSKAWILRALYLLLFQFSEVIYTITSYGRKHQQSICSLQKYKKIYKKLDP